LCGKTARRGLRGGSQGTGCSYLTATK